MFFLLSVFGCFKNNHYWSELYRGSVREAFFYVKGILLQPIIHDLIFKMASYVTQKTILRKID